MAEQKFDILILGVGRITQQMAHNISQTGRNVGMVRLPDDHSDYLTLYLESLNKKARNSSPPFQFNGPIFSGAPTFETKKTIRVGDDRLSAQKFILAPGVRPLIPSIQGIEDAPLLTPISFYEQSAQKLSTGIIGQGHAAVVCAQESLRRGGKTTLFCNGPRLLPHEEPEISATIGRILEESGISIYFNTNVIQIHSGPTMSPKIVFESGGNRSETRVDQILLAAGLRPEQTDWNLEIPGVYIDPTGQIITNDEGQTAAPHIWALNTGNRESAHIGLERQQASLIESNIDAPFFGKSRLENHPLPYAMTTTPEFARIGKTEKEAMIKHRKVLVSFTPLENIFPGKEGKKTDGFIKIIGSPRTGQVYGMHILCPHAAEIILYADLLIRAEIPLTELMDKSHFIFGRPGELLYQAIKDWNQNFRG